MANGRQGHDLLTLLLTRWPCRHVQVALFMETRMEWMLTAQAVLRLGATLVTLYATLGDDGIAHVLEEVESSILLTSSDLLHKLKTIADRDDLKCLKEVVYVDTCPERKSAVCAADGLPSRWTIRTFEQLEQRGQQAAPDLNKCAPTADDIALIMYTSGSTGIPKVSGCCWCPTSS